MDTFQYFAIYNCSTLGTEKLVFSASGHEEAFDLARHLQTHTFGPLKELYRITESAGKKTTYIVYADNVRD